MRASMSDANDDKPKGPKSNWRLKDRKYDKGRDYLHHTYLYQDLTTTWNSITPLYSITPYMFS
jgi:hypothetical protein